MAAAHVEPGYTFFGAAGLGFTGAGYTQPRTGNAGYPADNDALRSPDLPQPEEDRQQADFARPQRGRVVIAEDGKELYVPPLETWADKLNSEDREFVDLLNARIAIEMAKTGADDKRGHPQTQRESTSTSLHASRH